MVVRMGEIRVPKQELKAIRHETLESGIKRYWHDKTFSSVLERVE